MELPSKDPGQYARANNAPAGRSPTSRGLAYWRDAVSAGKIPPHIFTEMMTHPRFADACRASQRFSVENAGRDPVLARVTIDTSRLVYGYLVLYLDARGAITLKAVQDLCADIGLASHGRAQAILFHLRAIGYLQRDPDNTDRRSRRYLPSQEMKAALRACIAGELRAFALMEPEAGRAAERLVEPEFFRVFVHRFGEGIVHALKYRRIRPIGHFTESNAGYVMLRDVLLTAKDDDSYPPRGPLKMSVRELARKYNVSRTHILRVFRGAETRGLLTRNPDAQTVTLDDAFGLDIAEFETTVFLGMATCAQHALEKTVSDAEGIARA